MVRVRARDCEMRGTPYRSSAGEQQAYGASGASAGIFSSLCHKSATLGSRTADVAGCVGSLFARARRLAGSAAIASPDAGC